VRLAADDSATSPIKDYKQDAYNWHGEQQQFGQPGTFVRRDAKNSLNKVHSFPPGLSNTDLSNAATNHLGKAAYRGLIFHLLNAQPGDLAFKKHLAPTSSTVHTTAPRFVPW
jgi:hypothetical protein